MRGTDEVGRKREKNRGRDRRYQIYTESERERYRKRWGQKERGRERENTLPCDVERHKADMCRGTVRVAICITRDIVLNESMIYNAKIFVTTRYRTM